MARTNTLKPLDRIVDTSRPELGELSFSAWAAAFIGRGEIARVARCYRPGVSGQVSVAEKNIRKASDVAREKTMAANGTRSGRPMKIRQPATAVAGVDRELLKQRLNLTDAELDDALAD